MSHREIEVYTNCFPITRLPTKEYYQYDVGMKVITPETKIFRKRQEIMQRLQNKVAPQVFTPKVLYDGNALVYSSRRLRMAGGENGSFLVSLSDVERGPINETMRGVVKVTITRTVGEKIRPSDIQALMQRGAISSRTATATNLLQLLIKQATNQNYPHNARAFFSEIGKRPVGGGLELWRGFFQSVRPTIGRIVVNVDTSVTAMYQSGNVYDLALSYLGLRDIRRLPSSERDPNWRELERFLKNLQINVEPYYGKRTKVIRAIIPRGGRYEFDKEGRMTTVADHAQAAYRVNVRLPDTFGVVLSGKNAPRPNIVPGEVCVVLPGQLYKKKLPPQLTSDMVSFATSSPRDRLGAIRDPGSARTLASPITGYGASEYVVESGMEISREPLSIRGRILATPMITMQQQNPVSIRDGAWNLRNQRVAIAKPLRNWAVINFISNMNQQQAVHCADGLYNEMRNIGMQGWPTKEGHPTPVPVYAHVATGNSRSVTGSLQILVTDFVRNTGGPPHLIVVLFPDRGDDIRNEVKRFGDVECGIITQHMKGDKLLKANNQYYANVAIKINARLGGSNHLARSTAFNQISSRPFMIMGADISHNSPGALRPSISSLVWSHDQFATQYVAFSEVQNPRTEELVDLKDMAKKAILMFVDKNRASPYSIVFYRDGLSEGEIHNVGRREVELLQAAVDEIWVEKRPTAAKPKITFLVVGKRHHMVFFGKDGSVLDRTGNLQAGFVTTHGVSSPLFEDFYLQSHAAIKGTARSGHYIILRDDTFKMDQAQIQDLSYTLCHTYAKATRSVSIPTPVYYAHEVCTRGAFHFAEHMRYGGDDASSTRSGAQTFDLQAWKAAWKGVNGRLDKSMYFL